MAPYTTIDPVVVLAAANATAAPENGPAEMLQWETNDLATYGHTPGTVGVGSRHAAVRLQHALHHLRSAQPPVLRRRRQVCRRQWRPLGGSRGRHSGGAAGHDAPTLPTMNPATPEDR